MNINVSSIFRPDLNGVLLVGCIVFLGMTGTASATCGDYLMVGRHDSASHQPTTPGNRSGSDSIEHAGSNTNEGPSQPCHGPGCHQEEQVPVPDAPLFVERQSDDAYVKQLSLLLCPEICWLPVSARELASSGAHEPLERPPQQWLRLCC